MSYGAVGGSGGAASSRPEVSVGSINTGSVSGGVAPSFGPVYQTILAQAPPYADAKGQLTWNLPFLSKSYVQRPVVQAKIISTLRHSEAGQAIVLSGKSVGVAALKGLGGVGKTQLASHFIHTAEGYRLKAWFNAENINQLKDQYVRFGLAYDVFLPGASIELAIDKVKLYLETHPNWLIVYDNAESFNLLKDLLPKTGGHIIITSRTRQWESIIDVDVMKIEEARELVKAISGTHESDSAIDSLANKLSHLPLAIAQASAYIKQAAPKISIAEYLTEYDRSQHDMLSCPLPIGHEHEPVAVTWQMSFNVIKAQCSEAISLLQACAFLDAVDIPVALLRTYMNKLITGTSDKEFRKVLDALINYSFLKYQEETDTLSIHRLVQDVIRNAMNKEEQASQVQKLAIFFNELLQGEGYAAYRVIQHHRADVSHLEAYLTHANQLSAEVFSPAFYECLLLAANIHNKLEGQINLQVALAHAKHALDYYKADNNKEGMVNALQIMGEACVRRMDKSHVNQAIVYFEGALKLIGNKAMLKKANALHWLGNCYHHLGGQEGFEKALEYFNRALNIRKMILGDHEIVIESLLDIAGTYSQLSKKHHDQTFEYANQALQMSRGVLAEIHPFNALALKYLATVYIEKGSQSNQQEAIKLYEQAIVLEKAVLGESDRSVAITLHGLGNAYLALTGNENILKAIDYYNQALAIKKALLGGRDRSVAITLHELGNAYQALAGNENILKAIDYYNKALAIYETALGESNREVALTLHELGSAYQALTGNENVLKAIDYYNKALAIEKAVLGESNREVALTLHELGNAYQALTGQENVLKAIEYYNQALTIKKAVLGESDREIALTLHELGNAYQALASNENILKAIDYYNQTLAIEKAVLGESDKSVAVTLHELGNAYRTLAGNENILKAIDYYNQALTIKKAVLGESDKSVAFTLHELGSVYRALAGNENILKAIDYYNQALAIEKAVLSESDKSVAVTLHELGNAYLALAGNENIFKAIDYYNQALAIKKSVLDESDRSVATTLHKLGNAYRALAGQENILKANDYYNQALAIKKAVLGESHQSVAITLHELGRTYKALTGQENVLKAIDCHNQALAIYKSVLGESSREVAASLHFLAIALNQLGGEENNRKALDYAKKALAIYNVHFPPAHAHVVHLNGLIKKIQPRPALVLTVAATANASSIHANAREARTSTRNCCIV